MHGVWCELGLKPHLTVNYKVSNDPDFEEKVQHHSIGLGILVNAAHSRARKRFSYAHEFAHALMDREAEITVSSAENASQLIEKRANAFAAAFLMPRGGIAEALRNRFFVN